MMDPFDRGRPGAGDLDTLSLALERGWDALERGDFGVAARVAAEALSMDHKSCDAHSLRAAAFLGIGDDARALEHVRTAIALEPHHPLALLQGAELLLYSFEAADDARELAARAVECAQFAADRTEALLLRGEAELASERPDEAAHTLDHLVAALAKARVDQRRRIGELALALDALDAAAPAFRAALTDDPDDADSHYGLGLVARRRGRRDDMVAHWQATRRLDADAPAPSWHLTEDEFLACAERAFAALPERARALLENVPILVADRPDRAAVDDGVDPRLLGLFSGLALPEQVTGYGVPSPPTIHLYQSNLEAWCRSRDHLEDEIAITLWHETAHYFGLDDDALEDIGLG